MHKRQGLDLNRLTYVSVFFLILAFWIVVRMFILQIVRHDYYALFALNAHEIHQKLYPERGAIYFQDTRTKEEYPAAVNKQFYLLYAVPKEIPPDQVASTSRKIASVLGITDPAGQQQLFEKLAQQSSAYKSLAKKVEEGVSDQLKGIKGIYATSEDYRYYPEGMLAANVLGFVGANDDGTMVGKYGIEGYWNDVLAGKGGFISGEKGALGGWITLGNQNSVQAENGPDLLLSIDRTLQYKACERLRQGMTDYQAKTASLVLMNPKTGAVLAMCSLPDFDPNNYSKTPDISAFNNTSIFTTYEPGSVFKTITMAAGLDLGLVNPQTTYTDPCELVVNGYHVRNAQQKCYGLQTMTQVLEKSINTGAAWVEEKLGNDRFKTYVDKFGFGQKTGITLGAEGAGDVSSLSNPGEIFGINGSFGQGLTATPLQVAVAYSAVANDGKLLKPYVVQEVRYPDGKVDRTTPQQLEQVISPRAAKLLDGMLVSVVENHYNAAKIPSYYVAGKTGTAQVPEKGGYSIDRTNHTFAGFAPATDPELVLVVKYEEPQRPWAEQTALPVFKDVMQFALNYYAIPGDKQ